MNGSTGIGRPRYADTSVGIARYRRSPPARTRAEPACLGAISCGADGDGSDEHDTNSREQCSHCVGVRDGTDTPRSDAFEEPVRRQSVKHIAGAEVHVGWRSGSNGAATEGAPRSADASPEMRLTGLRAASRSGVCVPPRTLEADPTYARKADPKARLCVRRSPVRLNPPLRTLTSDLSSP